LMQANSVEGKDWAIWLRGVSSFLQGSYEQGLSTVRSLRSDSSEEWQSKSFTYTAAFLAEQGRLEEATADLVEGSRFDHAHGRFFSESEKNLAAAFLMYRQKECSSARNLALKALLLDASPVHIFAAGTVLARCGYIHEAEAELQEFSLPNDLPRVALNKLRLEGEIALAKGTPKSAIKKLREAAALSRPREIDISLARALATDQRFSLAMNSYLLDVERPGRFWMGKDDLWPGMWADSLHEYLSLLEPSEEFCLRGREYFSLRNPSRLDPSVRSDQDLHSRFIKFCSRN
jgi:hypothetical protein